MATLHVSCIARSLTPFPTINSKERGGKKVEGQKSRETHPLMPPTPYQLPQPALLHPLNRYRYQLMREMAIPHGLLDLFRSVGTTRFHLLPTVHRSVVVQPGGVGLREPVEGDVGEDEVQGGGGGRV